MGQNVSQPQDGQSSIAQSAQQEERPRRRTTSLATLIQEANHEDAGGLLNDHSEDNSAPRPSTRRRLSRLISSSSIPTHDNTILPTAPHRSALSRSRSSLAGMFRRGDTNQAQTDRPRSHGMISRRTSYMRASGGDTQEQEPLPRLPSIDQTSIFDQEMFSAASNEEEPRSSHSLRRNGSRFMRRPDSASSPWPSSSVRRLQAALRRRRSPTPALRRTGTEDQAALLSQLLSAAAAATAATLMGDDHQAYNEARSLSVGTGIGELAGNGEDGSFNGFLRALQSGRIASALRQSGEAVENGADLSPNGPLNFFRMFRFGAPVSENNEEATADSRMIPIIIVGIRSISPNSREAHGTTDDLPPFLDALTNFASPNAEVEEFGGPGQNSIDAILRPPQNGTSFRHRRRASMGGFGMSSRSRTSDRYDDQRSPERRPQRPWSVASSMSNEPRPPPATPASPSPELSRIPSRNSTPSQSRPASFIANSLRELAGESRRNSVLHRSTSSPLAIHTEETVSVHSTHSSDNLLQQSAAEARWESRRSDNASNVHYPRFASGHPRRNGVVEPDNLTSISRPSTSAADGSSDRTNEALRNDSRSWIIYVLGGSYPENHPILTTPSLFSDNPTYEDMMLLSALLGPVKAPVATEEDVQNAGGVYTIVVTTADEGGKHIIAVAAEGTNTEINPAQVALETDQRCLVCLCEYEAEAIVRRLGKCGHLFHKECIDQWLTQGRNSCPLCRGEGVEEKPKNDAASPPAQQSPDPAVPAAATAST